MKENHKLLNKRNLLLGNEENAFYSVHHQHESSKAKYWSRWCTAWWEQNQSISYHGFVHGATHPWRTFSIIHKERQWVPFLIKTLFLAPNLGKPFKDHPHLWSNTMADRIQVCPSPAIISVVFPQTSLLSTTPSSVHSTRSNPLYFVSFHQNCVSSTEAHLKPQLFLIHGFDRTLATCKYTSIRVSRISVTYSGPEVPREFEGWGTPTAHHLARDEPFTRPASLLQNYSSFTYPEITANFLEVLYFLPLKDRHLSFKAGFSSNKFQTWFQLCVTTGAFGYIVQTVWNQVKQQEEQSYIWIRVA